MNVCGNFLDFCVNLDGLWPQQDFEEIRSADSLPTTVWVAATELFLAGIDQEFRLVWE